jgi:hypothetical protein
VTRQADRDEKKPVIIMKCLFLSARRYSVNASLVQGLEANGVETLTVDYEDFFSGGINGFIRKFEALPNRVKGVWKDPYINETNRRYMKIFDSFRPDMVLIYNNQNVQPWLLERFRKSSSIAFILGDHPLYTPTNIYGLRLLFYADYVISPDSFWTGQLAMMGVPNIVNDTFTSDTGTYFRIDPNPEDAERYGSEVAYIGTAHKNSWGYKRFLFLSQFRKFGLKAYMSGDGYSKRWKEYFPELSSSVIAHHSFDTGFNNKVYNYSKVCPVDLVPSLFNGVHVRTWDILGAGSFPLCEYSKDLEAVFSGLGVPLIRKFSEAPDITGYLLRNEQERAEMTAAMKVKAEELHSPEKVVARMLTRLVRLDKHV